MQKISLRQKLLIVVPPIMLLLVGISIYIVVIKIITPDVKVISALPDAQQSSVSASPEASASSQPVNKIDMNVATLSEEEIKEFQAEADSGHAPWRYDVVKTAEHMAGNYGFTPGDQLTLVLENEGELPSGSASVIANHGDYSYILTLKQPDVQGEKGIWVLTDIEER